MCIFDSPKLMLGNCVLLLNAINNKMLITYNMMVTTNNIRNK